MVATTFKRHPSFALVLLGLAIAVLAIELCVLVPSALARWYPWDYSNYVKMGLDVRQGVNPYGPDRYYPLPTMLWVFVPLSFMPDWFRLAWIIFPFLFVLILFRKEGLLFFLFPPLWWVITDAMFDGWLLIPFAWLLSNRPILAGIGASFLLFKPHILFVPVLYMALTWVIQHDWRNLASFCGTMLVLWLPSLWVNPAWPAEMLAVLQTRMNQAAVLPLINTSVWSFWSAGLTTRLILVIIAGGAAFLFLRAVSIPSRRTSALFLSSLLVNPVVLASNLIMTLPILDGRREILTVIAAGWVGYFVDGWMGGFGGGYILVPLTCLYFQVYPSSQQVTPGR